MDSGRKFLLMPVQESNDDATVNILVDGSSTALFMCVWQKLKVDYCVPFDMEQYAGHDVVLNIVTSQSRSSVRDAKEDACWSRFALC